MGTGAWLQGHLEGHSPGHVCLAARDIGPGPLLCAQSPEHRALQTPRCTQGPGLLFSGPAEESLWQHTSFCSPGLKLVTLLTSVSTMFSEMGNPSINML